MKKILAIAVLALGISFAAAAQPKAIGLRWGWNLEASYQHNVNGADFVEANLGTFGFDSFDISSTYNFMIAQPAWTARGEWGFYAGPGLALGFNKGVSVAVQAGRSGIYILVPSAACCGPETSVRPLCEPWCIFL